MGNTTDELRAIEERYTHRVFDEDWPIYSPLNGYVLRSRQERERALVRLLNRAGLAPVADKRALEIGCGVGSNLLDLLRLGFRPENLVGNELLPARAERAAAHLPGAVKVITGDATALDLEPASFDIVYQSTVFTSILDNDFRANLAAKMWSLVRPGGGVLWYDFAWSNPRNPNVRGVGAAEVRRLFPAGTVALSKVTLAPPLGRPLCRFAPSMYSLVNALRPLRTHLIGWVAKPV